MKPRFLPPLPMLVCMYGWLLFYLPACTVQAQTPDSLPSKWEMRGYLKDLQITQFTTDKNSLLTGNLLHHRLNMKWYATHRLTLAAELRNRLFYGEQVKYTPNFAKSIDVGNGIADLSVIWASENALVLHTIIDRFYIDYQANKWSIRAGRQRINWGVNTAWNPNDLFNTYNFLDFDYEERPGTDAVRVQYFFSDFTNLELAIEPATNPHEWVAAAKGAFNRYEYDFQVLGGIYKTDAVAGLGWAGNILNAGFKGEVAYFHPYRQPTQNNGAWSAATGLDYMFAKGWYLNGAFLYNSAGQTSLNNLVALYNTTLSPKNLMPTRYNLMLQTAKSFTPLLNGSMAVLYSPNGQLLGLLPAVSYNLSVNWDIDLITQCFFARTNNAFNNLGNAVYLRLKWSY